MARDHTPEQKRRRDYEMDLRAQLIAATLMKLTPNDDMLDQFPDAPVQFGAVIASITEIDPDPTMNDDQLDPWEVVTVDGQRFVAPLVWKERTGARPGGWLIYCPTLDGMTPRDPPGTAGFIPADQAARYYTVD